MGSGGAGSGMLGVLGSYTPEVIQCDQCNKKFKSAQGLKYHMMHHTGMNYFLFYICSSGMLRLFYIAILFSDISFIGFY